MINMNLKNSKPPAPLLKHTYFSVGSIYPGLRRFLFLIFVFAINNYIDSCPESFITVNTRRKSAKIRGDQYPWASSDQCEQDHFHAPGCLFPVGCGKGYSFTAGCETAKGWKPHRTKLSTLGLLIVCFTLSVLNGNSSLFIVMYQYIAIIGSQINVWWLRLVTCAEC